ncbi:MAG: FlgD immunoglobulin-like domain containing protein [Rubrivivax sp.]
MNRFHRAIACSALAVPLMALGQVQLQRMSAGELASATGAAVVYTVRTEQPGTLSLELLTGDGDVVRRLVKSDAQAGAHQLSWDGKDERGQTVPDEAYCARAVLQAASGRVEDDPCKRTGGEVLANIKPSISPNSDIAYTLEKPARVLIRVGIKNGAMMRSLSVWRPRPAGRNLQRWNGFDESGQVDLRTDRLALLVTAFQLPDFSVITTGQDGMDYRAWRTAQGWPERPDTPVEGDKTTPLERNGVRIARQHYMARYKDSEPRITVAMEDLTGKSIGADGTAPEQVRLSVDLHPEDRWLMQEQLYEVAFFVDGDFVSEEENGYVPIGWLWNTSNLKPGRHLLTVNLTGFTGRVGTKTIVVQK